ncbi:MAG: aconitase X catalytic domain-containing protein [Thermoplasmatota archaeon]
MYLSPEQEGMLAGEEGEVVAKMMRLLVRLGDVYGADRMLPVSSVQVSGVSYKSIGDPGLEFLQDFAEKGARVRTLTYLNPAGMDLEDWRDMGIGEEFAARQQAIIEAFRQMGIVVTATCTPYLAGNLPRFREHIAWAESSAVSFANSVIGARTNREGGPSALAAAVTGLTPNYGLHLDENRHPHYLIDVQADLDYVADFGALGYVVGKEVKNRIPFFTGIQEATTDHLKALGAAMAASGAVALYHVEDMTPEAHLMETDGLETLTIEQHHLQDAYDTLTTGQEPDVVITGCPHASLRELMDIARMVKGKRLRKPLWVCTSRAVKETAQRMGLVEDIMAAGGRVVADTCMVVAPIENLFSTTAVNSGKAAAYLPGFCKQQVVFNNLRHLLEEA